MKSCSKYILTPKNPLTPKMKVALTMLSNGATLDTYDLSGGTVGRPTKQRIAKFGFATFDVPGDWDGPMHLTPKGLAAISKV